MNNKKILFGVGIMSLTLLSGSFLFDSDKKEVATSDATQLFPAKIVLR